ncbi:MULTISPECIES: TorD/DmsD family molecular chaperone [Enterobacteriaceae]|uniref:Molecular chaperone n=2 Tax=Atlantibacter subterraneus TaxID=255519 RepID=A0ABU4DWY0_9ENTR|nr:MULTISPECIES: molecular chaperone [Enterobacteriaceae]MDV7021363.1 molecular chaperone [Atlantibacter subterranea]MDZ5664539.1 molecular chaperone [Atlantibacter hermannii]QFH71968.1 molecular chaperone [Enterobacter sp. E76]
MNEFSIICRLLGSLYYRHPSDPVMAPIFTLIKEGKLAQNWPLEQDDLLARLQKSVDLPALTADYDALFVGEACRVPPYGSQWQQEKQETDVRAFLQTRGMPLGETPADHIGTLLLAASWLEDNAADDESEALETLFADYLLPWCDTFFGKVEANATTAFWRTLAQLSREAVLAMWDELTEEGEEEE